MRHVITTAIVAFAIIGMLLQPAVLNTIISFLFLGIVPGTDISLPFWAMSLILFIIGYTAMRWLRHEMMFIGDEIQLERQRKQAARNAVITQIIRPNRVKKSTSFRQRLRRRQQHATS